MTISGLKRNICHWQSSHNGRFLTERASHDSGITGPSGDTQSPTPSRALDHQSRPAPRDSLLPQAGWWLLSGLAHLHPGGRFGLSGGELHSLVAVAGHAAVERARRTCQMAGMFGKPCLLRRVLSYFCENWDKRGIVGDDQVGYSEIA